MQRRLLKTALLFAIVLTALSSIVTASTVYSKETSPSKIVFKVACYDVGKAALEGLPGVEKVTRGFSGFHEINSVYYHPELISIEKMTQALKAAGTYIGISEE